eukprot:evm.model.NODE_31135_length_4249_cov_22.919275.1
MVEGEGGGGGMLGPLTTFGVVAADTAGDATAAGAAGTAGGATAATSGGDGGGSIA